MTHAWQTRKGTTLGANWRRSAPIESRYITWCQKCQNKTKQKQEEKKIRHYPSTSKRLNTSNMKEIKGQGEMDFTSLNNVSEIWRRWKRGMEYFLAATCSKRSKAEKVAIFMCMIGMMVRKSKILLSLTEQKTDQRSSQQKFYLRNSKPSVNRKRISSIAIDFSPEINSLASQ